MCLLGPFDRGDVLHDADGEPRRGVILDGSRLHPRPSPAVAMSNDQWLRMIAGEHQPTGQQVGRHAQRAREVGPVTEQRVGGRVAIDDAPCRILDHNRVGDRLEDRLSL